MKKRLITKNVLSIAKIAFFMGIFIAYSSCQTQKREKPVRIIDKAYKESIIESRNAIRTFLISSQTPGLSISVSHNNKTIWSEGFGYANKELKAPSTKDTKYRIGSTSSMFTVLTLAKMQEKGLIDLKKSFYDYIPEFPKKKFDFSPYLLGANAAGFTQDEANIAHNHNGFKTLKEFISFYKDVPLDYEPGTYTFNSNYSIALLGILAEHVSKNHYQKLVKETIIDTLQLNNTRIDNPALVIENRSACYDSNFIAQLVNAPSVDLRFIAPVLGFLSTADDLNTIGQTLLNPGFFSQESLDLFFKSHVSKNGLDSGRGFGWMIAQDSNKRTAYVQMGTTVGGSSGLIIYPEEKLVISICLNMSNEIDNIPSQAIANHFLDKIFPPKETK